MLFPWPSGILVSRTQQLIMLFLCTGGIQLAVCPPPGVGTLRLTV